VKQFAIAGNFGGITKDDMNAIVKRLQIILPAKNETARTQKTKYYREAKTALTKMK
jgi:hypothetical protein